MIGGFPSGASPAGRRRERPVRRRDPAAIAEPAIFFALRLPRYNPSQQGPRSGRAESAQRAAIQ